MNDPFEYPVIQVGQDSWHRENGLSGIMVYFENCLVDSYARGQGLPDVVPKKELGYLAIVSFSGPSDKRLFHPNPTKVLPIGQYVLFLINVDSHKEHRMVGSNVRERNQISQHLLLWICLPGWFSNRQRQVHPRPRGSRGGPFPGRPEC